MTCHIRLQKKKVEEQVGWEFTEEKNFTKNKGKNRQEVWKAF